MFALEFDRHVIERSSGTSDGERAKSRGINIPVSFNARQARDGLRVSCRIIGQINDESSKNCKLALARMNLARRKPFLPARRGESGSSVL